jgi:hypothetical protein
LRYTLTALAVLLALLGMTALVVASPMAQSSSSAEEETDAPEVVLPSAQTMGDDPDERGYEGEPYVEAANEGEPSGEGSEGGAAESTAPAEPQPDEDDYAGPLQAETVEIGEASGANDPEAVDWRQLMQEPQPDEENHAQAEAVNEPGWTGFYYIFVAGSTLRPRDSSNAWADAGGGGCVYSTVGNEIFNIHLDIPNGSRIDYVRLYYYDTSASNSSSWLTTYNGSGSFNDRASIASTGNSGYGTRLSPLLSHVVNTASNAYVLNWRPNQVGSTMRLCGFRVAYRLPLNEIFIPLILDETP